MNAGCGGGGGRGLEVEGIGVFAERDVEAGGVMMVGGEWGE